MQVKRASILVPKILFYYWVISPVALAIALLAHASSNPRTMLLDITAQENLLQIKPQPFAFSSNAHLYHCKDGQKLYKSMGSHRELDMMLAAGDCTVQVYERVSWAEADGRKTVWGFTMKRETPIDVKTIHPNHRSDPMHGMTSSVIALHDKGIIHGAVKPANMLLCSDGTIRLCDLAEARLLSEDPADWEGMTTANYVSPHRCQKNSNWPGDRNSALVVQDDVYALGLSIWELWMGEMPFDGVYADDIREMVKAGQTVDVTRVQDGVVRGVICDCLRCGGARINQLW
jgi:hypothetical protein